MISFYLPDFYYLGPANYELISLLWNNPEYFKYEDMQIGAIYGCFPNQIWNGGRLILGNEPPITTIANTIKGVNDLGVPVRFTYTNCLITEEHLDDLYCNFITEYANNGLNEILVNSPILEKYLREKYKNYKFISSATRCLRDLDKINEYTESGEYYLVLGDYRDNFNFDFLSKLKHKDKIEILINPYCQQDCKMREFHYQELSRGQLGEHVEPMHCPFAAMPWYEVERTDNIIKTDDLQKYIDMGFSHFKIEGRGVHFVNAIDSIIYYLIKPEYQNMVRNILLRTIT